MTSTERKTSLQQNRSISFWLKSALDAAEKRDCVDAYHDALALADYCRHRMAESGLSV